MATMNDGPPDEVLERARKHFFSSQFKGDAVFRGRKNKARDIIGILETELGGRTIRNVLSIGASFCIIEEEIQKALLPGAEFICTDLDEAAMTRFDQPTLTKRIMSATALDFPDASFDLILAHMVLEHINEYPAILLDLARMCRPGGLIYINIPNPMSPAISASADGSLKGNLFRKFVQHNRKKFEPDFWENTEKYHTGFTPRRLAKLMPGFRIMDKRKVRAKQLFRHPVPRLLIDLYPSFLLFLLVSSNIWVLEKRT
jgi:2-polyprenyl-3-methyl-5-hydroxy-6-metoxy-1,4-benzoquinol methylase